MALKSAPLQSSDDPAFDDIGPCRDRDVQEQLQCIISDRTVISSILRFRYPLLSKSRLCSLILGPLVKRLLMRKEASVRTIAQFQQQVADFMEHVISATTDGVTYEGFDELEKGKGYLFISNHRDISLDPAFIDMALFTHGLDTVRIAIGDNLLRIPAATSLMRLNKSFIVRRSLSSPREKLKAFTHLSEYIGLSVAEGHSVWIAQREGRAKDGNDRTEDAVLKMIGLNGRTRRQSFGDYMKGLNIVPVAISYEYDPNDEAKARELCERAAHGGEYHKEEFEDIETITRGIRGEKGRICVRAGEVISGGFETPEELAAIIDTFIWSNYEIFPPSKIAAGEDEGVSDAERARFESRLSSCPEELREQVRSMYAAPLKNRRLCLEKRGEGAK
ncbi:MAG: 1-acyl-sn-glycerol-3-phosphate acyltransferase [Succinivibrio sp.]|nr:1-acyl-sn-glycerol-3-phosphate acyltransferase [Succinivibrio sp.]